MTTTDAVDGWETFRELDEHARVRMICPKLCDRLNKCRDHYREYFPVAPHNDAELDMLLQYAWDINSWRYKWIRRPIEGNAHDPTLPQTHGEMAIELMRRYFPLWFGWKKEGRNGGQVIGIARIIHEHFTKSEQNEIRGFLCIGSFSGMKIAEVVWALHQAGLKGWNDDRLRKLINRMIKGDAPED